MGEKKENTPGLRDRNGLTEEEFLKSYKSRRNKKSRKP